tara:strand:- start:3099 stop:3299 length:201 start_codon:yes stop_codon:yes gene_type:complete
MADTNKRIIYTDSNGVNIVVPAPNNPDLTIEQLQSQVVPDGVTSYIVDKSVVPTDRSFRDAWTYTP